MSTPPTDTPKKIPLVQNWLSLFGFWLAMAFLAGEAIIIIADMLYGTNNPYIGILIYLVGPAILVFGLLLVPFGMWLEYRKQKKGQLRKGLPVIDFNNSQHRLYTGVFSAATIIFLALTCLGSYQAYHLTESVEFCGLTCHQVMKPEYVAYQESPHARVACVQCHIGSDAEWYVKTKLSGIHQVYAVMADAYELPIDTPIENLVPARQSCEACHWPEKFFSSVERNKTYYALDDENSPYQVSLLMHIGGSSPENPEQSTGIHWHIGLDHKLEYYATDDDRQEIPWVRVTHHDGSVDTYIDTEAEDFDPNNIPQDHIRTMDCIDCHNRPSHRYISPVAALNQSMQNGLIDTSLPEVKFAALEAIREGYETQEAAVSGIRESMNSFYEGDLEEGQQEGLEQTIAQVQKIYKTNFFPEQKVDWTKYPWNKGHYEFPGCYRCHDGNHLTQDDNPKPIRADCNLCHDIVRQGEGWDEIENLQYKQQEFIHPREMGDLWEGQNCHECHGPDGVL